MTINREPKTLGEKHLVGGSSLTVEKVREEISLSREVDFSVVLRNSTAKIAAITDETTVGGQYIGFSVPTIDKGGFWDDAFPTTLPTIKTKIRVDNKPKYFDGIYDFGGEAYLEKNPTGERIFNIAAHAVHVRSGVVLFSQNLWRDSKLATNNEMPMYINQKNFEFRGTAFRQQVATAAKLKPEDIAVYIYMALIQTSNVPLTLYSAGLWFQRVGDLPSD